MYVGSAWHAAYSCAFAFCLLIADHRLLLHLFASPCLGLTDSFAVTCVRLLRTLVPMPVAGDQAVASMSAVALTTALATASRALTSSSAVAGVELA